MRHLLVSFWCVIAGLAHEQACAQEFETLQGHGGPIMDIDVATDGRVVSGSFDNSVGLWQGTTMQQRLEGHDAAVSVVTATRDGQILSGSDDFTVRLWQGDTSRIITRHLGKVRALALSPDGKYVATGSWDGSVQICPIKAEAKCSSLSPGAGVNALAYDPDGRLYVGTMQGMLLRYDPGETTADQVLNHGFGVTRLIVAEGWIAYGAVDGVTRVIDTESGEEIANFGLDRRPILAMAYHPESAQLAVGDGQGYIMMINTDTWRITRDFRAARDGPVWALDFSPDGKVIYAGGLDDVIYAWPVELLDRYKPQIEGKRSFLRPPESMPNGERQFMRKCSICHSLEPETGNRKAGPSLWGVLGRPAGSIKGYHYSPALTGTDIIWTDASIDALFKEGPERYIPGSKMPMQVIADPQDRADLINYLKTAGEADKKE